MRTLVILCVLMAGCSRSSQPKTEPVLRRTVVTQQVEVVHTANSITQIETKRTVLTGDPEFLSNAVQGERPAPKGKPGPQGYVE